MWPPWNVLRPAVPRNRGAFTAGDTGTEGFPGAVLKEKQNNAKMKDKKGREFHILQFQNMLKEYDFK